MMDSLLLRQLIETLEKLVDRNLTFTEGLVISGLTYKDIQQAREVLARAKGEIK
jgi:hypothetical protein